MTCIIAAETRHLTILTQVRYVKRLLNRFLAIILVCLLAHFEP